MPSSLSLSAVDARMLRACSSATSAEKTSAENNIVKAIEHHLAAGGSRVRANFSLEASRRLGVDAEDAITLATICELLHNASLIHDDLLDRAPMRRGLASVWADFSDSTAVCAGDLLLSNAFALVGEIRSIEFLPKILALVHQRTREVILGQDAEQSSAPCSMATYEVMAAGKSASLLSLPFELSLLLSGNAKFLPQAQRASQAFAVSYQMLDDIHDYAEDRRNGSLNAVSVAMTEGSTDYAVARAFVCSRADALIESSLEDAAGLPMGSGAAMIVYAQTMRVALRTVQEPATNTLEPSRHAG
jgi:geranylgeranyl pyrophosphate synthase